MSLFDKYRHYEVQYNVYLQEHFSSYENFFEFMSETFGPDNLISYGVPLVGIFDMGLMVNSAIVVGLLNVLGSLLKWIFPMCRPFWWVHENNGPTLRQHALTCESTSGFPSGHLLASTGFFYLVITVLSNYCQRMFPKISGLIKIMGTVIIMSLIVIMIIVRMYFGCHFLHQCVVASLLAIEIVEIIKKPNNLRKIYHMDKLTGVLIVIGCAVLIFAVYFGDIYRGIDPMWSVKMAFKWCEDPTFVKLYRSPVFTVGKDLGFLMGIALSAPLLDSATDKLNFWKSIPLTILLIALKYQLQHRTLTNYGRIAFVGYGFTTNLLWSYSLIKFLPYCTSIFE